MQMVGAGMQQLQKFEDIYYLRDALTLSKTEDEAAAYFMELVKESLSTTRTVWNNAIHILAHPN